MPSAEDMRPSPSWSPAGTVHRHSEQSNTKPTPLSLHPQILPGSVLGQLSTLESEPPANRQHIRGLLRSPALPPMSFLPCTGGSPRLSGLRASSPVSHPLGSSATACLSPLSPFGGQGNLSYRDISNHGQRGICFQSHSLGSVKPKACRSNSLSVNWKFNLYFLWKRAFFSPAGKRKRKKLKPH